jgi:XTP/dITP diphosphohydrolase
MSESSICVLASGNRGKLVELSDALEPHNIRLVPQSEYDVTDADETAVTFVENALIKARHASLATGLPALADDSGLVVPVLAGAPGIYSARYADLGTDTGQKPTDADNMQKLLHELRNYSGTDRAARFVCVLAFLQHANDPEPIIAIGHWSGRIADTIEGDGGFGYDPIFFCPQTGATAAAMGKQKKQAISHRAAAITHLQQQLSKQSAQTQTQTQTQQQSTPN